MSKKKSMADLKAEIKILRRHGAWTGITKVLTTAIPWAGAFAIAHELAGKLTLAIIEIKSNAFDAAVPFATIVIAIGLALLIGAAGLVYGIWQNGLRRATIEALAPSKIDKELQHDAKRSSSGLAQNGQTNPEDT